MDFKDQYQGKYKRLEPIGKGNFGVIYLVKSMNDGKNYVAKHIPLKQIEENIVAEKQLEIIKKLKHPYIVEYVDSFLSANDFIIIMEYCKERDLRHHIQLMTSKNKYFNQNLIITWLFQLVLGIQFIHSKKILHRDIKPENIFIDQNLNVKIGDFGISKILNQTGQHCKTMAGTYSYMAPQIINSEPYTAKADIWSLGCVFYEICTLEKPFVAKGPLQLMNLIKCEQVKEIKGIYSENLKKVIMKMLIKDQNKRLNTTQLLKDPALVDLMIKNSSSMSLKKQYSKGIDRPSTLSDSFINNQTNMVHEQLKKFQKEVEIKMQGLKQKNVNSALIDNQYKQLKKKMLEIQKAVNKAFQSLKEKATSNNIEKNIELQKSKDKNFGGSSLTDSSQMTIIESVMIGENTSPKKQNQKNQSNLSSSSKFASFLKNSISLANSSMSAQSMFLAENELENSKNSNPNSNLSGTNQKQSQSFEQTLQSQYQKTINSKTMTKQTIEKLEFLQKALTRNPNSILNQSLLNFTLTISQGDACQSLKGIQKNLQSMKQKSQGGLDDTINFNLTKRQIDDSCRTQKTFSKKGQKLNSEDNSQCLPLQTMQSKQLQDQCYEQDFQQYAQNQFEESESTMQYSDLPLNFKRRNQLETIKSFYQQTLSELNNLSEIQNQPLSQSQRIKNKHPLVMSQIEQQVDEAGSLVSKKNKSTKSSHQSIKN